MSNPKNYQILKLVAKGGTAVLYKAIQTSLDRTVAVKKLHSHLTEDENFTRRFILEAKAAASLDHDNIVKIIDFGSDDGTYYMVMEFIEGESLREVLDRWKQVPIDVALATCYHVLQGLEHAHAKGIVHRDIKPGNIMLTRTGKVKVTDFGLAKLTQSTTQHTAANSILGTPLYMSPEQAFGESVDHRSDLFSLGTMLYELITGIQPFRDENYMGVIQNILKKNAPHPSRFNVEVPQAVQSLLSKAMNKSRDARFQSAADFKKAIEKYMGLAQLKDSTDSVRHLLNTDGETVMLPKTIKTQERKSRLRRGFIAALTVATLFGAAGIGYTLAPPDVRDDIHDMVSSVGKGKPPSHPLLASSSGDQMPGAYLDLLVPDSLRNEINADSLSNDVDDDATAPDVPDKPKTLDTSTPLKPPSKPKTQTQKQQTTKPKTDRTPKYRKGWLSITTDPWSEVYVDGTYHGDSPPTLKIELPQGRHTVECRNPKYKTYYETIRIIPGELSRRSVVLQKINGRLDLTTMVGAEVFVDGRLIGTTPLSKPIDLDPGDHQVTIKKAGHNTWNNQIHIRADETLPLRITLSPSY